MRAWLFGALLTVGCGGPFAPFDAAFMAVDSPGSSCPDDQAQQGLGGGLCINEVQLNNHSSLSVTAGEFPAWVELYHRGDSAFDLSRATLSVNGGAAVPLSGLLLPGERKFYWADGLRAEGHLPVLDADGGRLTLSVEGLDPDELVLGKQDPDQVWARFPDGGFGRLSAACTPDAANGEFLGETDPSERVFGRGQVQQLAITVSEADIATLETTEMFGPAVEVPAGFGFVEGSYPQVGLRLKGGYGTFRNRFASDKLSFKLDFNAYEDRRWRGLEGVALNGYVQDPTTTHEYLTYLLYRAAGSPAPRVGFAQVSVNGEDYGLYVLVEQIDDRFLRRWFADASGPLYEGAYGPDFSPGSVPGFEYDEGPEPPDFGPLEELAATLDLPWDESTYALLSGMVDMDQFTLNMAIEHATFHWDGYTTSNNYRMYHDPSTGLFSIIPWGTDQTWTAGWPGFYADGGRLQDFCMAVASCREQYRGQLVYLAGVVDGLALEGELDGVNTLIDPYWMGDPRRSHSEGTRQSTLDATRARVVSLAEALRAAAVQ